MPILRDGQLQRVRWWGRHPLLGFRQEQHDIGRVLEVTTFFERIQRGAAFAIAVTLLLDSRVVACEDVVY